MNKQQIAQVSVSLQELSMNVSDFLERKAGEPVAFVLVVATGTVMQYVSNASREDGVKLLQELFDGWLARRASIPAHYNPDLRDAAEVVPPVGGRPVHGGYPDARIDPRVGCVNVQVTPNADGTDFSVKGGS